MGWRMLTNRMAVANEGEDRTETVIGYMGFPVYQRVRVSTLCSLSIVCDSLVENMKSNFFREGINELLTNDQVS